MRNLNNNKNFINSNLVKRILYGLWTLIIIVGLTFIIGWGARPYRSKFNKGDIAVKSIYAPFSFTIKGDINKKVTAELKRKKASQVKDVYVVDTNVEDRAIKRLDGYIKKLKEFSKKNFKDISVPLKTFNNNYDLSLSAEEFNKLLHYPKKDKLRSIGKKCINEIYSSMILSSSVIKNLKDKNRSTILVSEGGKESIRKISSIVSSAKTKETVKNFISKSFSDEETISRILSILVSNVLQPNLEYSEKLTKQRIKQAKSKISPVYNKIHIKKNELVVEKGKRISKNQIKMLNAINKFERKENRIWYLLGIGGIIFSLVIVILLFIYFYQPELFNAHDLLLISILFLMLAGIARGITISPLSSYLIPVASVSMLSVILLNFNIAILVTMVLSIITGLIIGNGLTISLVFFISGILSIFVLWKVRKRMKIFQAGIVVGVTNFILICGTGLFENLDYSTYFTQGVWGLGSGFFSVFLVMGLLPVFEYLFNITTDISLLELSDLNHPLLKRMILEAPGTYHHSLMVGNLAESACEAIGANSLLARVGSYFHDIGKIEKAEYFSENQTQSQSKHDKLTPDMSRLIIIKHVKDGAELAKKYKLKQSIINFINQHHGTGLVFYFFKRALDEKVEESEIEEEHYRYPGPTPQTKETAVVLLADSVEAASRALSNPTPARIKGLVKKVINNKFIDRQLDECDLTLKELDKIANVFIRILIGVFHSRTEYPEKLQKDSKKNDRKSKE